MGLRNVIKDEAYWHRKHPRVVQLYNGRPLPNGDPYEMDVRNFIWTHGFLMEDCIRKNRLDATGISDTALNVQKYVVNTIRYEPDTSLGASEFWMFPVETLVMQQGDCEDGAILMASLLCTILDPSDHWRVRVVAGTVQEAPTAPEGGHGYCVLCRPEDNEWVVLDWCYLQDADTPVADKILLHDNGPYKKTWFSFSSRQAYAHEGFELRGRLPRRA